MATEPIGGHVSAEAQTPLYYLRGQQHQSDRSSGGNNINTNSGSNSNGMIGAAPIKILSLEEARRIQLRDEHPTYNEFMIDMTLYQEQQSAREVNRKRRETIEKQKERRLAARLKEVDTLVSLPSLKDANGNPVPLDKKAFAWLRQYHPQLADQFTRLIRLSVSVVDSAQQRNVLSNEEVESRVSARELELKNKADEHEKQRMKERQQRVDRLEWFRTEYEKRKTKAEIQRGADEQKLAKETLSDSRQKIEAATARRQQQMEAASRALHEDLLERSNRLQEHQREVIRQENAPAFPSPSFQRRSHHSSANSSRRGIPLRAEEIAAASKARNTERDAQHAEGMLTVQAKAKERADGLRQAQLDAQKKLDALEADRKALTAYQHSAHTTHSKQVIGRCVESLELALKNKQATIDSTEKRIDAAVLRREAASAAVAERARDSAVFTGTKDASSVSNEGTESPRYASSIGNLSPRSSVANMSRIAALQEERESPKKKASSSSRHDVNVLAKATEMDEQKYTASLAALDRAEKEAMNASKRRGEYIDDIAQQRQLRAKHDAKVRERHEKQLEDEMKLRLSKVEAEDGKVRVFIPQPPRLYKGMKVALERPHVSPPRIAKPTSARTRNAQRDAQRTFNGHLSEVKERFQENVTSKRTHTLEAHDQQLHRETAAEESRRSTLRELQYETKRNDVVRHRAADQRVDGAMHERLERTYDHTKLNSVSSRRNEALFAQTARSHDTTVTKQQLAEARRDEVHEREERRVLDDVQQRQQKHQRMFQLQ
ncbi:Hypothetical protein, putative [Bodo saltans]|uniref:Uncharacterized protein n=1 Tax=Bodo saltans TaxID=75058 RepID=A0A0S4JCE4_BODSA|nr:Hypothetical protein, putative [Bodo saltans]|eukprot:CUG86560.1 Hypothetical protein, putative [Bodo saltans]